jgi:hypothetical protein
MMVSKSSYHSLNRLDAKVANKEKRKSYIIKEIDEKSENTDKIIILNAKWKDEIKEK